MTTLEIQRGANEVRRVVSEFLETAMPPIMLKARADWELEEWQFPDPTGYSVYDPMMITNEKYPLVGCAVTSVPSLSRIEEDALAQQVHNVTYRTRIGVWTRTGLEPSTSKWEEPPYDTTLRQRDDYAAVIKQVLLTTPSLGTARDTTKPPCRVDEDTFSIEYFDAQKINNTNGRYAAGVSINFDLNVQESLWVVRLGEDAENEIVLQTSTTIDE